jgi:uncharacterized protein (TIGR00255 family)
MLHSMTGYGRSENTISNSTVVVEIKSLNGKQFDLFTRMPQSVKPHEIEIKNILQKEINRGSVELNILIKQFGSNKPMRVNTDLAKYYYDALQQVSTSINEPTSNALSIIMQMPEVVSQDSENLDDATWQCIKNTLMQSLEKLNNFRQQEGVMLHGYLNTALQNINKSASQLGQHEQPRIDKMREKLQNIVTEFASDKVEVDKNRLEQELVYYIEKLDIMEEKSRLAHHCAYFEEILNATDDMQKGKKLGFILQEIGREINTIGSKANDAHLQKLVVQMKDDLEKAKEQSLNVL